MSGDTTKNNTNKTENTNRNREKSNLGTNKNTGWDRTLSHGIGFLFRKINIPSYNLSYWISVPEFVEDIKQLKESGVMIDESIVFDVMKKIYKMKLREKESGGDVDFKFYPAKKSLRALSEFLTGDKDAWEA